MGAAPGSSLFMLPIWTRGLEFLLLAICGARMNAHTPQATGTNPGIGPFQVQSLNYDSSPLVCSVTIWWVSVKILALSILLLSLWMISYYILHDSVPAMVHKVISFFMKQMEYITKAGTSIYFVQSRSQFTCLNWRLLKAEDTDTEIEDTFSPCTGIHVITYPGHLFNQIILLHPFSSLMPFYCIRQYLGLPQNTYSHT